MSIFVSRVRQGEKRPKINGTPLKLNVFTNVCMSVYGVYAYIRV